MPHQMTHRLNQGWSVRDETAAANKEKIGHSDIKPTREMDQSVQKRMQVQALRPINSSIKKWCNNKRGPCQFICAVQKIIQQQASDWSIFRSKERCSSKYLLFEQTTNQKWSALVDKRKKRKGIRKNRSKEIKALLAMMKGYHWTQYRVGKRCDKIVYCLV